MEEKKQSLASATMIYGLLLAVAVIIFSLIIFLLDLEPQSPVMYVSYVIMVAGILLAQFNYRNKQLGGFITYGQAFVVGLLTSVFASVLIAIYTYINFIYIDPGSVEEIRLIAEERLVKQGMTDLQIDQTMKMTEWMYTPLWMSLWAVFGNVLAGAIISLITSIFVKKEDQSTMPRI